MILSLDQEDTSNNSEKKLGKKCFIEDKKGNFIIKKANFSIKWEHYLSFA